MKTLIKNVRLETSYHQENHVITKTNTDIFDVLIEDGVFTQIEKSILSDADVTIDAKNQLMIPAFKEMHTHLDKTYFGGEWIAVMPAENGVFSRMEEERKLLVTQEDVMEERAHAIIKHYIEHGHLHIRAHTNVDPVVKSNHVKIIKRILEQYEDVITYDIVAFPQHGLLINDESFIEDLEEALDSGATHIGGLDPASIDRNIRKNLELTVDLAIKHKVGIDIHLHDADTLGAFEIHTLLDIVEEKNFKGEVTLSHAFALAGIYDKQLDDLLHRLKEHDVKISSTIAIGAHPITLPILYMDEKGIDVSVVHDSLIDHWYPFGSGNSIHKLNSVAQRFGIIDEFNLSQLLKFSTKGITPLNKDGERVWPNVNDEANLLLVDAMSSAHMIARKAPISTVISRGKVVVEKEFDLKGAYFG